MSNYLGQDIQNRIERAVRLAAAKQSYVSFLDYVRNYIPTTELQRESGDNTVLEVNFFLPEYVRFIANYIDKMLDDADNNIPNRPKKVIISLPVQHGKTHTISEHILSYLALTRTNYSAMLVTYSKELSESIGLANRQIINQYGGDFCRKLAIDSNKKNRYTIDVLDSAGNKISNKSNKVLCTTVFGQATGFTADLTLIDDMYSGISEVYNAVGRKKIESLKGNLLTRKSARNVTIVIMSRWSNDDVVGQLLESEGHYDALKNPNGWTEIRIPAIRTIEDSIEWVEERIGRKIGEPLGLHINKGLDFYEMQKRDMGDDFFSCLFQQNPRTLTRELFPSVNLIYGQGREQPLSDDDSIIVMSCDLGASDKKGSDESAFSLIRMSKSLGNDVEILDVYSGVHNIVEMEQAFYALYERWSDEYPINRVLIENKASGIPLLQLIARNSTNLKDGKQANYDIYVPLNQVYVVNPTLSKDTRLLYLSRTKIYIPDRLIINPINNNPERNIMQVIKEQVKMTNKVDVIDSIAMAYIAIRDSKIATKKERYQALPKPLA